MNGFPDSQFHKGKSYQGWFERTFETLQLPFQVVPEYSSRICALDPEFYSGQDTHKQTDRLSVILGFAKAR